MISFIFPHLYYYSQKENLNLGHMIKFMLNAFA